MSNTQFVDLYEILGLEFGASEEEIKKAYRRLARKLHPDMHIGEDLSPAEEAEMRKEFTKVTEAYDILNDENDKREYDARYVAEQVRREEFKKKQEQQEAKRRAEEARREEQRREEARAKAQSSYNYSEDFSQQEEERNKQRENNADERRKRTHKAKHRRKGFADEVVEAYKEIRKEEKKNPYKKRHKKIDKLFEEEYDDAYSLADEIIIDLKKGVAHISVEFFYQLGKLTYINKDTVTKYVIRNRKTFAAIILAGAIMTSTSAKNTSDNDVTIPPAEPSITQSDDRDVDYSQDERKMNQVPADQMTDDITLTRMYTVEFGDCLSTIAFNSNSTVSELKRINDLTSDIIYEGNTLEVPYHISQYDIDYYTEKVQVEDKSLSQLAEEYETDVATIIRLNREAIEKINTGTYIVLSDTLTVPKYITRNEYSSIKESDSFTK